MCDTYKIEFLSGTKKVIENIEHISVLNKDNLTKNNENKKSNKKIIKKFKNKKKFKKKFKIK